MRTNRTALGIVQRAKAWKAYVEQTLLRLSEDQLALKAALESLAAESVSHQEHDRQMLGIRTELQRLGAELADLREKNELREKAELSEEADPYEEPNSPVDEKRPLVTSFVDRMHARNLHDELVAHLGEAGSALAALGEDYQILLARRSAQLVVLIIAPDDEARAELAGDDAEAILAAIAAGEFADAILIIPQEGKGHVTRHCPPLLAAFQKKPLEASAWLERHLATPASRPVADQDYFAQLNALSADIERLDFRARASLHSVSAPPPFDDPGTLPLLAAEPRRHSVLLLHNSYYHFNCLSAGLRRRGWDAVTVSLEAPDSPQRQFYHGEDINLFDPDPAVIVEKTRALFRTVPERFGALHFYGQGLPTFFAQSMENSETPTRIPWDFLELRRHRTIIGFMPSGCLDGGLQSSIRDLSDGVCNRCVWELRPDVCNDNKSLAWNRKLALICDWLGLEGDYATPERVSPKTVYGPVAATLDADRWHPDLTPPDDMLIERQAGEVLIYHAVGNYALRRAGDRDIKGTGAVMAAIEQLKAEGLPVRLIFAHDLPSTQVRYLQVQADIVVDQLNYGRYGANAREAMMLGRPTICRLQPRQAQPLPPLRPVQEVPILDAGEDTIVDVLRALVLDQDRRLELSSKARDFAVAWHGEDACAERYEKVIARIRAGLPPDSPDLYPA